MGRILPVGRSCSSVWWEGTRSYRTSFNFFLGDVFNAFIYYPRGLRTSFCPAGNAQQGSGPHTHTHAKPLFPPPLMYATVPQSITLTYLPDDALQRNTGYNPTDPNNCSLETFLMARKRMTTYKNMFNPKKNPCAAKMDGCKSPGTFCQCTWALAACPGNRPDCPVTSTCARCPPGFTCPGTGFAVKNKKEEE